MHTLAVSSSAHHYITVPYRKRDIVYSCYASKPLRHFATLCDSLRPYISGRPSHFYSVLFYHSRVKHQINLPKNNFVFLLSALTTVYLCKYPTYAENSQPTQFSYLCPQTSLRFTPVRLWIIRGYTNHSRSTYVKLPLGLTPRFPDLVPIIIWCLKFSSDSQSIKIRRQTLLIAS
jgi:hypothetical protein